MASKLNQWLAVSKGVQARAKDSITAAYHVLQKPVPLSGISRTYQPKNEDGDTFPEEHTLVQVTAEGLLADVTASLSELFDVTATREWANCEATADVVVDGVTLLAGVPVTFLLFLEKQLVDIRTFVAKMPILDPAETWTHDPATGSWVTEPAETNRTQKVPFNHVKAVATKEHPAQVEVLYTDIVVGTWTKRSFSGAMAAARVQELTERVDKLAAAVKFAREEANMLEVEKRTAVGAAVFGYVNAGALAAAVG